METSNRLNQSRFIGLAGKRNSGIYSARPDLHRIFPRNIVLRGSNWTPELVDRDGKQNSSSVTQAEAVRDLLNYLGAHNSRGPDRIHPKVMRELAALHNLSSVQAHWGDPR